MSIWNKCEEAGGMPFYGTPVQMNVKEGKLLVNFPMGYKNNIQRVANKLAYLLGDIENMEENSFVIVINEDKLANFIYFSQFEFGYNEDNVLKCSIGSLSF